MLLIGELLHDIEIEALTRTKISTCSVIGSTPMANGETRRIPCLSGTIGSVIKITRNAKNASNLVLCEVEVYGAQGKISISNCS